MKKAVAAISFVILLIGLPGCSLPGITIFDNADPGTSLGANESISVNFFTTEANLDTGVDLQAGSRYVLDIIILNNWIDSDIDKNDDEQALDERGFSDARMAQEFQKTIIPFEFARLSKRSRQHNWFELMLYQPNCKRDSLQGVSDLNRDEASGSYNFIAACDGKLTLFVNDSHGFYSNNVGYANISLSRVN